MIHSPSRSYREMLAGGGILKPTATHFKLTGRRCVTLPKRLDCKGYSSQQQATEDYPTEFDNTLIHNFLEAKTIRD